MTRPVKPSPTQRRILQNLVDGNRADYGRPFTQSHAAGWGCSYDACIRRGWIDRDGQITEQGRAAL